MQEKPDYIIYDSSTGRELGWKPGSSLEIIAVGTGKSCLRYIPKPEPVNKLFDFRNPFSQN